MFRRNITYYILKYVFVGRIAPIIPFDSFGVKAAWSFAKSHQFVGFLVTSELVRNVYRWCTQNTVEYTDLKLLSSSWASETQPPVCLSSTTTSRSSVFIEHHRSIDHSSMHDDQRTQAQRRSAIQQKNIASKSTNDIKLAAAVWWMMKWRWLMMFQRVQNIENYDDRTDGNE